jgi:co-chaperonin GroES (HSP10)
MNFPIKPVGNKLIVLPLKKRTVKSEGGLEISESEQLERGEVVAVSSEVSEIAVGEIVLYPQKVAIGVVANQQLHFWLQNSEVWGIESSEN